MEDVVQAVIALPEQWHRAGSCSPEVYQTVARLARAGAIKNSAETGTGKTTLLLSHLSASHTVFTRDDTALGDGDSLLAVRRSPLLQKDTVTFVLGPTQRTLPRYEFTAPLDLVIIDGPHAYPFPDLEYYYFYPHLRSGALLVVDDIHIPTVHHLFRFLRDDAMFDLIDIVQTTAFFRRTSAPTFDALGDEWHTQRYNMTRFPVRDLCTADVRPPWQREFRRALMRLLPAWLKAPIKWALGCIMATRPVAR